MPSRGPEIEARKVAIHEFDDQVNVCLERRGLLVLGVSADRAIDAELALVRRFGLSARSFDALFVAEFERQMRTARVQDSVVYETDAAGAGTASWPRLVELARRTIKAITSTLLPPSKPLLLTQLGLVERYGLAEFLQSIVDAARADASEAIFLLAPGHERGVPRIGDMQIPDLLPGQATWIPKSWIGDQLEAAAS